MEHKEKFAVKILKQKALPEIFLRFLINIFLAFFFQHYAFFKTKIGTAARFQNSPVSQQYPLLLYSKITDYFCRYPILCTIWEDAKRLTVRSERSEPTIIYNAPEMKYALRIREHIKDCEDIISVSRFGTRGNETSHRRLDLEFTELECYNAAAVW